MPTLVQENASFKCVYDEKVNGYSIRIATFTVDENGGLIIGQSSRVRYNHQIWTALQQEIEYGRSFMAKVKVVGGYNVKPAKTIKPKQYTLMTLYEDIKGRGILYLGEGTCLDVFGNCSGCKYLYGVIKEIDKIKSIELSDDTTKLYITTEDYYLNMDSYAGKPTKLVKAKASYPTTVNQIVINGYAYNFALGGTFYGF